MEEMDIHKRLRLTNDYGPLNLQIKKTWVT